MTENNCPCDAVKKLQEIVDRHEKDLAKGSVQFAVINTKLNIVIGIIATIGVALCSIVLKLLFRI